MEPHEVTLHGAMYELNAVLIDVRAWCLLLLLIPLPEVTHTHVKTSNVT